MMISTRGRYALRVMIELAESESKNSFIPLREISLTQGISLKYLERILPLLVSNDLVEGLHGKGGGYRLTRDPSNYTVGEILKITENGLAPVACLSDGAKPCERESNCQTLPLWKGLSECVSKYLDDILLSDLCKPS